jgi:putative aldouronate transport system substrate-binding protein
MTQDHPRTDELTRRRLLGMGAGVVGGVLLGACSNAGRGVQPGDAPKTGLPLPNSVPPKELPGTRLSSVKGVPAAYGNLALPGYSTVSKVPGSGGKVPAFSITWGAPPKPLAQNPWHQAINTALGVNLDTTIVPAQSFGDKLVTTIASGEIPDITTNEPSYRGRAARKYLPQGVFHDLREQLGGDKVKDYPNLAVVPEYAWRNSRINGAIYGVPCYRNQTIGGTICYRQDWAERGGMSAKPTNADEMFAWLTAIKAGGGAGTYPLATIDQTFNFCGGQVAGVPNNWRADSAGKLTKDLETDEFEAGLVFANKLWKAGLVHPDVLTLTPNSAQFQGYFVSGRIGICNGSIDSYFGTTGYFAQIAARDPKAVCDVLVPPGANGGHGVIAPDLGYYCMLSIPASVKDPGRVSELLRIIDFLAAPIGSKEYYLVHYGVEGHNYDVKNGVPIPSAAPAAQNESFLSMLGSFSTGFSFPGAPADEAMTCQKYAEQMTECFVPDPTAGLDSETSYSRGDALSSIALDYVNAIVTGRKPVSSLSELRKRWKANGGDKMRAEYEKAISELASSASPSPTA